MRLRLIFHYFVLSLTQHFNGKSSGETMISRNTINANNYHAYMQGWFCAVKAKQLPKEISEHPDAGIRKAFVEGYDDGRNALQSALQWASSRFNYTPTILRGAKK